MFAVSLNTNMLFLGSRLSQTWSNSVAPSLKMPLVVTHPELLVHSLHLSQQMKPAAVVLVSMTHLNYSMGVVSFLLSSFLTS